jgi:hypothetical protein
MKIFLLLSLFLTMNVWAVDQLKSKNYAQTTTANESEPTEPSMSADQQKHIMETIQKAQASQKAQQKVLDHLEKDDE